MTNIFKKGGRNLTANILIIKQYVIISMFPVCTGINRKTGDVQLWFNYVPCMHRDKPALEIDPTGIMSCSLYAQG